MSKKIYGDPRRLHLDMFPDFEIETEERRKQEKDFSSLELNKPVKGTVQNLVYLGKNELSHIFNGEFKDYVRVENRPSESKYLVNTQVGDMVDVFISEVDEVNYFIKGSLVDLYENKARKSLTELDEGSPVIGYVRELTPAGYSVEINYEGVTLSGFMPNTLAGINKLSNPESIVGESFEVMIETFSREEGTYIVSRKKYLQSLIPEAIKQLEFNKVYEGFVTGATDFGVFVEFNECLTGMIHKSNINPEYADKLKQIIPGTNIDFYIKEIIKDTKIILTQIIRETLWDTIRIGQVFDSNVKDIKPFGALVVLDDETNGLVHTSELNKSNRKVNQNDSVKVKVLSVDRGNRKIFLSLV
jgi:small subunit ribosomal protein S1